MRFWRRDVNVPLEQKREQEDLEREYAQRLSVVLRERPEPLLVLTDADYAWLREMRVRV